MNLDPLIAYIISHGPVPLHIALSAVKIGNYSISTVRARLTEYSLLNGGIQCIDGRWRQLRKPSAQYIPPFRTLKLERSIHRPTYDAPGCRIVEKLTGRVLA